MEMMKMMNKTGRGICASPERTIGLLLFCFLLFLSGSIAYGDENKKEIQEKQEIVTIWQASDLHYLSPSLTDHGAYFERMVKNADGKVMDYCEEVVDSLIQAAVEEKPDVCILSGDLTFNGARKSHEEFAEKLLKVLEAGVQVLVIPGNHDIACPYAATFSGDQFEHVENLSGEGFLELYHRFGYDDARSRDEASLSYMAEVTEKLRILMLDVNTEDSPGFLKAETREWVERELIKAHEAGARVIAVSHQNIFAHNRLFFDSYVIGAASSLPALYQKYGVLLNLSGHMHIQHIQENEDGFCEIAVSSLMSYPNQYNVIKVGENSLESHTVSCRVDLPEEDPAIAAYGSFEQYAHDFFWDLSYQKVIGETDASEEDMRRFFADVNIGYFSGRLDQVNWDDALYERWRQKSNMVTLYLMSIVEERDSNQTRLTLSY